MKKIVFALSVLCLFVITACSGVPSSSNPQVIRTVENGVAGSPAPTITPVPNSDPRTIVSDFLRANLGEDAHHAAARAFLTQDARNKWADTTVAVVDTLQVSVADPVTHAVTVSANQIGTLDQRGIYTPLLQGDGSSGTPVTFTFSMQQVAKQWRISQLSNGLLVSRAEFAQSYVPRKVYFLDQAQSRLVPDLRYSTLSDSTLSAWLLDQLTNPPRAELQSAVTSDLPEQSNRASAVFDGSSVVVNLPGSSQISGATRYRLAAQLAFTYDYAATVSIVDGTRPVDIPNIGTQFGADDFASFFPTGQQSLYYLRSGAIVDQNGVALPGTAGSTNYGLRSLALSSAQAATLVAGTTGSGSTAKLLVGTSSAGLKPVVLAASALSRPAWAPGLDEVWVGAGNNLVRVDSRGVATVVQVAGRTPSTGVVQAVSFSPDGVRLAMVIAQTDGTAQLWIGSVVRSGDTVRVDGLLPVTPPGLILRDVAWNDPTTLYAVGSDSARPGAPGIWSVQVDGSVLTARTTAGLPDIPDSIAAAPGSIPWVSASGAVWVQRNASWAPPSSQGETTLGTSPTYLQ